MRKRPQNANIDRRYNEPTFRKERVEQLNNVSALDYMTEKQRTSNVYTPNKGPNLMMRDSGRDSGYKSFIKPIPINNDISPVSDSVYPFDQNNTNSRLETPYISKNSKIYFFIRLNKFIHNSEKVLMTKIQMIIQIQDTLQIRIKEIQI